MIKNIGICGQGFVGSAVKEGLKKFFNINSYDKFKKGLMALVGRKNYRTYILNNMTNTFEVNKGEIDTTEDEE